VKPLDHFAQEVNKNLPIDIILVNRQPRIATARYVVNRPWKLNP